MDLVEVEFDDGMRLVAYGDLSLKGQSFEGMEQDGEVVRVRETASNILFQVDRGHIECVSDAERIDVEPGEYLICSFGLFRRVTGEP